MPDRRALGWVIGLVVVALGTAMLGCLLVWWSSDLQMQADTYWRSQSGTEFDEAESQYFSQLFSNGWTLQGVASPVLGGAVFAVVAGLAVLARLWDRAER